MSRLADKMANVKTPDLYTGEPPLQSAHNTWKQVKTDLAYALGPNVHRSWTGRLHITQADESVVTLSAPSICREPLCSTRAPELTACKISGTKNASRRNVITEPAITGQRIDGREPARPLHL